MPEKEKANRSNEMFFEDVSPMDFNATLDKLTEEIVSKSWKVSHIYDLQKVLEMNDKEVLPVKILSLCHPNHSGRILEKDTERIVSLMMPCRISVYEKSDGKTYVSRMNSSVIASSFGGLVGEVMTDSANEVEEIITNILTVK